MLMVGMVQRFNHNLKRYHPSREAPAEDPLRILEQIRYQSYVYRNTLTCELQDEQTVRGIRLVLGQKIHHHLYRLHHRLLDFDAEIITAIIPEIDQQLRFWNPEVDHPVFLYADDAAVKESMEQINDIHLQLSLDL